MRLSLLLFLHSLLLPLSGRDVNEDSDVTPDDVTPPAESQLEILRAEVKKLRRSFLRFKRGGGRGKGKLCDEATGRINDAISMELSGLRSQLHVSDSIKSLRSELEYGLTSVRSELENKVTSVRAELETGMTSVRSEVQAAVSEIKTEVNSELTDIRAELQYNLNAACSGDKELTKAVADLQGSLQGIKAELESRISTSRAELEQRMMGVRTEVEGGMSAMMSQFKTDVVTVRSDLQGMVSDVRIEIQTSVAGTRSELQMGFTAAQSGLQNSMHALQADVMGLSSKAVGDMASLKAEMSGVRASVKAEVQSQMTEAGSQVKQTLHTMEEDQHQQLQHLAERLRYLVTQHSHLTYNTSTLRQDLLQVKTQAEKSLETLKDDHNQQMNNLQSRLEQAFNNNNNNNDNNMNNGNNYNENSPPLNNLTDFSSLLTSLQTKVEARLGTLRDDLDLKVSDLDQRVKAAEVRRSSEAGKVRERVEGVEKEVEELREVVVDGGRGRGMDIGGGGGGQLERSAAGSGGRDGDEEKEEEVQATHGGSAYVRWGRTGCPDNAQLVYSGVVGGSSYDTDGGAANRLCLTLTPQAGNVTGARTYIYGAEYKFSEHHDLDVVCAVCFTPLPSTIMIPGTQTCPEGWERQYSGHLTAGMVGHRAASQYLCLDGSPESRPGSQENRNGALFYYVFTECGSLPCPPYNNMYVSCVVCSR